MIRAAEHRLGLVGLVRAVPIRWRILSIATLNSAVVIVLALMIWRGGQVLGSAWEDVRQVRESDRILALLESETGRLQTLIHRYINQPNPELFAEILLLREAVLGTLNTRAATDPMLSGSVAELEEVTERFLAGFGELRVLQTEISKTYESRDSGARQGHGGAVFDDRGRDRPSRCTDLALPRRVPRSLHRDAGCGQFLLSVARDQFGRGRATQHRDHRAHHSRDGGGRRQRSAAHGDRAAQGPRRGAASGVGAPLRKADGAH